MLSEFIVLLIVVISDVSCQIDGEFWWLNKDFAKFKHGKASSPQFDDVNELDTDETARVIFRENDKKDGKSLNNGMDTLNAIHFRDETELATPTFEFDQFNGNNKLWERPLNQTVIHKNNTSSKSEDEFKFVFPSDDHLIWMNSEKDVTNKKKLANINKLGSNKVIFHTTTPKILQQNGESIGDKNILLPENICTFIKVSECIRNEGTLYEPWIRSHLKMTISNTQVVCCILPITTTSMANILFPDNYKKIKRYKRSNVGSETPALTQRKALMNRKYELNQKTRATTPATRKTDKPKIVNSDEYPTDPYWNIKNANIRNPNIPNYQDPDIGSDYDSQEDDYVMELPRPGLLGLYSDHKHTQSWVHNNKNKDFYYDTPDSVEEEDFEASFGYSTIDPRQDHHLTSKSRPRPSKISAASSRIPEPGLLNPTITFHSNPDFQVLQGFKLLNLMRTKNRFVRKTAENKDCDNNELKEKKKPPKIVNYPNSNFEDELSEANLKLAMFNKCGKTESEHRDCENGLKHGVVQYGGHPWIALVVLTKSEHSMLCYATLVHSRVAVSIADCINGKAPGEVSIIAGVRNLDEDLTQAQRRMTTVFLDPDYTSGNLDHTLALLYWLRPLIFDARVQPVCLGDAHIESSCFFVGWGGYDQEIHSDLRWQQASILAPQNCNKRLSKLEVSDALCAAVESRGTVTGVGGPLLCINNNRWSAVGIAVWRNDVIILLPAREWVMKNIISLDIM